MRETWTRDRPMSRMPMTESKEQSVVEERRNGCISISVPVAVSL